MKIHWVESKLKIQTLFQVLYVSDNSNIAKHTEFEWFFDECQKRVRLRVNHETQTVCWLLHASLWTTCVLSTPKSFPWSKTCEPLIEPWLLQYEFECKHPVWRMRAILSESEQKKQQTCPTSNESVPSLLTFLWKHAGVWSKRSLCCGSCGVPWPCVELIEFW